MKTSLFRKLLLLILLFSFFSIALIYAQAPVNKPVRPAATQQTTTQQTQSLQSKQNNKQPVRKQQGQKPPKGTRTFSVKGVSFNMIPVEGGTFSMGATPEQGSDVDSDERLVHSVTLSNYFLGETEVTQDLWKAVMGSNPSYYKGNHRPVGGVSYEDCEDFIKRLNQLTDGHFRFPTEAEWEFAARGGNKTQNQKYSGSDNVYDIAWFEGNSSDNTHVVKGKKPNQLGLYDMSGNVMEWCFDWYGDYDGNSQTNPSGPSSGSNRVLRGGCCSKPARFCRVSNRGYYLPGHRGITYGLRLALDERPTVQEPPVTNPQVSEPPVSNPPVQESPVTNPPALDSPVSNPPAQEQPSHRSVIPIAHKPEGPQTFEANGVSFTMIPVEGGTFSMGATEEQQGEYYGRFSKIKLNDDDMLPVHRVTVGNFMLGETEVTQELWEAVMGKNPSKFKGAHLPVENVSWNDCQKFIKRLNKLTRRNFRLPTEAEWEFAARGGKKADKQTKYSGSDNIDDVAWFKYSSNSMSHDVGGKKPNQLGLYDMTGNVFEWCFDWYGDYTSNEQINPKGPDKGSCRVLRGGGWFADDRSCRISHRIHNSPGERNWHYGLRLAL